MELLGLHDHFTWLLMIGAVITFIYLFINRKNDYWESRGVPSLKSYPFIGSLGSLFSRPFQDEELDRYRKYGRIYGAYEGWNPVLSIADLDLLKDILVKDFQFFFDRRTVKVGDPILDKTLFIEEGEDWKRIRTIISPVFSSGKLRRMTKIIDDCINTLLDNFSNASKRRVPVDCKELFGAFSMDVICSSAFGTKIDSHNDPNNLMVKNVQNLFLKTMNWRIILYYACPQIMNILGIRPVLPSITQFFKDVALNLIEERKKSGKTRNDFLQLLIDASEMPVETDELDSSEGNLAHDEGNDKVFQHSRKYSSLTLDEVVAQCFQFFFAGYDTSSTTLSFVAYLMALNPDCQERLIEEIDEFFSKHEEINYDDIKDLKYLDRVLCETIRLYTPVIRLERKAVKDYKLGDTGIVVQKDIMVTLPVSAIHHDPEYYPDPERFDPDRFLPENKESRHPFAFLPFGAGPRNCLGMRFAQMEMKLCLAQVFRRFRFKVCPKTKVPPQFYNGQSLLHSKDITLIVEARRDITAEKSA